MTGTDGRTGLPEMFSLAGHRALVTGASRGIGRAAALALADAGAVVLCAGSRPGSADETVAHITSRGGQAIALAADLSIPGAARTLAAEALAMGALDILVNNAGTIRREPAERYSDENWDAVMRTNLDATWQLAQSIGVHMLARGSGAIVNIASLLAFSGGITVPAYTASKHAVAGLTKALANEWAGRGVRVNAIAPGYFRTDNTQMLQDDEARATSISARIPAGRWGEPDDIAGAVLFLASRASAYVHGHVLLVDGGWMAR